MAEKQAIHAVHAEDQEELLAHLGLLDDYKAGTLKCRDCDRPVRDHGLGLVRMSKQGEIEVGCAEANCSNGEDRTAP